MTQKFHDDTSKLEILSSKFSSKKQMGLDLGYKVDVAAIPIKILSKFLDLAPSNFFLFSNLKGHLKGVRFNSTDEAKHAAKIWLKIRLMFC